MAEQWWRRGAAVAAVAAGVMGMAPLAHGEDNRVANGGFEAPAINGGWTFVSATDLGWGGTEGDGIEVWNGVGMGVPAAEGAQFVELNGYVLGAVYQDVVTVPGETLQWWLSHRARVDATGDLRETMQVLIGAGGSTAEGRDALIGLVVQSPISKDGQDVPRGTVITDGTDAWGRWSGVYVVPQGQTLTRFAFDSVTGVWESFGNFIDDVSVLRILDPGSAPEPDPTLPPDDSPAPVGQALPMPASGACTDVDESVIGWAGDLTGGWTRAWEPWAGADGTGGWACSRVLEYHEGTWRVAAA